MIKGKFESYPEDMIFPVCNNCKHYTDDFKCKAFPEGIPDEILEAENDHKTKFPGQTNDIIFEPKEER